MVSKKYIQIKAEVSCSENPKTKGAAGKGEEDGAIYHHEGERFGKKAGKSTLQQQ